VPRRARAKRTEVLQRLQARVAAAAAAPSCLAHLAHAEGAPCTACGVRPEDAREPFLVVVPAAVEPAPLPVDPDEGSWDE
jgi:hypothetical protein